MSEPSDAELRPYGWAPGGYAFTCRECKGHWLETGETAAKSTWVCRRCAVKKWRLDQKFPVPGGLTPSRPPPSHEDQTALETMRKIVALFDNTFTQATIQRNARIQVLVLGAMRKARK